MRGKEAHQQQRRGCPVTTMVRCATVRCTFTTERTGPGGSKLEDRSTPWGARSGPLQHPDIDLKTGGGASFTYFLLNGRCGRAAPGGCRAVGVGRGGCACSGCYFRVGAVPCKMGCFLRDPFVKGVRGFLDGAFVVVPEV